MALSVGRSTLAHLWPPFARAVGALQAWADYLGLDGRVISGFRSASEQSRLYAIGRTAREISARVSKQGRDGTVTDAPPGSSAHNYGLAIDVEGRDQRQLVELARQLGFGTVSWDPAHIEWPQWQRLITSSGSRG